MILKYAILAFLGGLGDGIRQLGSQQDDAVSNACNRLKDAYPGITYSKLHPKYINANRGEQEWLFPATGNFRLILWQSTTRPVLGLAWPVSLSPRMAPR